MPRPKGSRAQLDQAKVAYARKMWLAGEWSFHRCAIEVGTTRDILRYHFPEFKEWNQRKADTMLERYHARKKP